MECFNSLPLSSCSRHASNPQCQVLLFNLSNSFHTHLVCTYLVPPCDNPLSLSHIADADHACPCSGQRFLRPVLRDHFGLSIFTSCAYIPCSPLVTAPLSLFHAPDADLVCPHLGWRFINIDRYVLSSRCRRFLAYSPSLGRLTFCIFA